MSHQVESRASTGTPGLDDVLGGGLPLNALYLVHGCPGVGKTTLAMQFLLEGVRRGEQVLYVALTESRDEVISAARTHGWSLDGVSIFELGGADMQARKGGNQTMFHPAELELEQTVRPILAEAQRLRPARLVIDSLSEVRLLAQDALRYRRQLLALKEALLGLGCTVLLIDTVTPNGNDILETIVAGAISLEKRSPVYGATRRRLSVDKLRGVKYREGHHDYKIDTGGLVVFPRLVAAEHPGRFTREPVPSGVTALDALLGGGIERGTNTLIIGSAGTGKSSLATQYAVAAAARGEHTAVYLFEETLGTWTARAASLGLAVEAHMRAGRIRVTQIDPAELSPGELAADVRTAVEQHGTRMVIIDSLNGYLQSVPEESFLLLYLHELLTYLAHQGVTTMLLMAQSGLVGPVMVAPVEVSYLADAVILLRYFEADGAVRQAISVVKKRSGGHERTIREFRLDVGGVRVGEPLREFHGVLTGVPTYRGNGAPLMRDPDAR
jgi:circadian clock protein KaiC